MTSLDRIIDAIYLDGPRIWGPIGSQGVCVSIV